VGSTNGGNGGTATGGDLNITGGAGFGVFLGQAARVRRAAGGGGRLSSAVNDFDTTATSAAGTAGRLYGGGAAGAAITQGVISPQAGAAGANGIVIVTEFYE
jgi:hypothetical protein